MKKTFKRKWMAYASVWLAWVVAALGIWSVKDKYIDKVGAVQTILIVFTVVLALLLILGLLFDVRMNRRKEKQGKSE